MLYKYISLRRHYISQVVIGVSLGAAAYAVQETAKIKQRQQQLFGCFVTEDVFKPT